MGAAVGMVGGPLVAGIAAIGGAIGGLTQSIIENGNAVDDMEDMMDQLAKEYASGTLALDDESLREALMRVSDNNIELTNHLMSNVNATRELIESNG
jgi:hypothetical protein